MAQSPRPGGTARRLRIARTTATLGVAVAVLTTACTTDPGGRSGLSAAPSSSTGSSAADTAAPASSGSVPTASAAAPSPGAGQSAEAGSSAQIDAAGTSGEQGTAPFDTAALGGAINGEMEIDGTPGVAVLVRSPSQGDWTAAYGTRTVGTDSPVTTDDVFGLGEISHTVTATAILVLQQQGRLSLADPIAKYVPNVPNGDAITLENLGRYDSGLFSYEQDEQFRQAVAADPARVWTAQELLDISFAHPVDVAKVPGARIHYSDTDYLLLGMVVEKVTGTSAAEAYRTLVFDPLGLDAMGLSAGGALPDPHADGHLFAASPVADQILPEDQRDAADAGTLKPRDISAVNTSWASTAGGVYGTVADTADLFEAMVTAGPLLDQATVDARVADLQGIEFPDPQGVVYGFGIARYGQYYLYSGANAGFNTVAAHDPVSGTTIVILANLMAEGDGDAPVQALFAAITDVVGPVVVPAE